MPGTAVIPHRRSNKEEAFVKGDMPCRAWENYSSAHTRPFEPGENAICFEAHASIGNLFMDLMGLMHLARAIGVRLLIGTASFKGLRAALEPNEVQWSGASCAASRERGGGQ